MTPKPTRGQRLVIAHESPRLRISEVTAPRKEFLAPRREFPESSNQIANVSLFVANLSVRFGFIGRTGS